VADDYLQSARAARALVQPAMLRAALMVPGMRADYLLKQFRKSNFNVLNSRLQSNQVVPSLRLRWRLWRKRF